jgi:hypothetical protein
MDIAGCSLTELIDDPLINLLMKSDGVDRREVELLLERVARTASVSAVAGSAESPRNDPTRTWT